MCSGVGSHGDDILATYNMLLLSYVGVSALQSCVLWAGLFTARPEALRADKGTVCYLIYV